MYVTASLMTFSKKTCVGREPQLNESHSALRTHSERAKVMHSLQLRASAGTTQYLEDTTGLFVDQARYTLDSTTASQTPDGWLSDALHVVTKNLPVTLGTTLSKAFASLASARHFAGEK